MRWKHVSIILLILLCVLSSSFMYYILCMNWNNNIQTNIFVKSESLNKKNKAVLPLQVLQDSRHKDSTLTNTYALLISDCETFFNALFLVSQIAKYDLNLKHEITLFWFQNNNKLLNETQLNYMKNKTLYDVYYINEMFNYYPDLVHNFVSRVKIKILDKFSFGFPLTDKMMKEKRMKPGWKIAWQKLNFFSIKYSHIYYSIIVMDIDLYLTSDISTLFHLNTNAFTLHSSPEKYPGIPAPYDRNTPFINAGFFVINTISNNIVYNKIANYIQNKTGIYALNKNFDEFYEAFKASEQFVLTDALNIIYNNDSVLLSYVYNQIVNFCGIIDENMLNAIKIWHFTAGRKAWDNRMHNFNVENNSVALKENEASIVDNYMCVKSVWKRWFQDNKLIFGHQKQLKSYCTQIFNFL